jgi:hypothetical protein
MTVDLLRLLRPEFEDAHAVFVVLQVTLMTGGYPTAFAPNSQKDLFRPDFEDTET